MLNRLVTLITALILMFSVVAVALPSEVEAHNQEWRCEYTPYRNVQGYGPGWFWRIYNGQHYWLWNDSNRNGVWESWETFTYHEWYNSSYTNNACTPTNW